MTKHYNSTRKMVICAILCAIIVVLQLLSYVIHIGTFNLSLVLIPIVMGGILLGPGYGALFGAVFGIVTVATSITGLDAGGSMLYAANPFMLFVLCISKGALAGFCSSGIYKLAVKCKANEIVSTVLAAITAPVVNTGVFCAITVLFYMDVLKQWAGGTDILTYIFLGLIGINFIIELGLNIILCPMLKTTVKAFKKM